MGKFNLTATEKEIMEFFWNQSDKSTFGEIYNYFVDEKHKTWKKQTLQTHLLHLVTKNVLINQKKGNTYLYYPKISKNEYIETYTKEFLDNIFGGSIKKLLFAIRGKNKLDDKSIEELKEFLEDNEEI